MTGRGLPSASVQDYLKVIYTLSHGTPVTTSAIAGRLGIQPGSVSGMIHHLALDGLVVHEPYRGVVLTAQGEEIALQVLRRHRLVESFLRDVLDMPWHEIHAEAELLEHAVSDRLEQAIADFLGHPTHDPHGDPIPPRHGPHQEWTHASLAAVDAGARVQVERVSDREPEALRFLARLGIVPGTVLAVEGRDPFGGPLWVRTATGRHPLGPQLSALIWVSPARRGAAAEASR